jgi:hypothetical protein
MATQLGCGEGISHCCLLLFALAPSIMQCNAALRSDVHEPIFFGVWDLGRWGKGSSSSSGGMMVVCTFVIYIRLVLF